MLLPVLLPVLLKICSPLGYAGKYQLPAVPKKESCQEQDDWLGLHWAVWSSTEFSGSALIDSVG